MHDYQRLDAAIDFHMRLTLDQDLSSRKREVYRMNKAIEDFVNQERIAVVGVSDRKFGGTIYKALKKRGYTVYPVHPIRESFDGDPCYPRLDKMPAEVKAAVVAVSPEAAKAVVEDARTAGVAHLWFQQGKNFSEAEARARDQGISTISRKCILMYAQPVGGIHAVHRFLARFFGRL